MKKTNSIIKKSVSVFLAFLTIFTAMLTATPNTALGLRAEAASGDKPLSFPIAGPIVRSSSCKTNGLYCDYVTNGSIAVYAPADGTVQFRQTYSTTYKKLASYGNNLVFTAKAGTDTYSVVMAHLSSFNNIAPVYTESLAYPCSATQYDCKTITLGQINVHKGELLGYTGCTGNASGHHIHLEVKRNNVAVSPSSVFSTWVGTLTAKSDIPDAHPSDVEISSHQILVTEDINAAGAGKVFDPGVYDTLNGSFGSIGNDKASYMKIGKNAVAVLYSDSNCSGTEWILSSGEYNFVNNFSNLNDCISSFRVMSASEFAASDFCKHKVLVTEDINASGTSKIFQCGSFDTLNGTFECIANDKISYMAVGPDTVAILYSDSNCSGTEWILSAGEYNFINNFCNLNDCVSSFRVMTASEFAASDYCRHKVLVTEDINASGTSEIYRLGSYDTDKGTFDCIANDKISYMAVGTDTVVVAYNDSNCSGTKWVLYPGIYNFIGDHSDMNDLISSFTVMRKADYESTIKQVFGDLTNIINLESVNGSSDFVANENKRNLFDRTNATKFLTGDVLPAKVAFSLSKRSVLTSYAITSANDEPGRDPASWVVQARNSDNESWITIDSRTGETFSSRFCTNTYTVNNASAYSQYRIKITENRGNIDLTQFADFVLYGYSE